MTARTRGIIFFFFVALFLISAPLLVLYTSGYRYHFGTGRIVQTGALSVKSIPRGADVSLDGTAQRTGTPVIIDNVSSGEHSLEIHKEGYTPWKKTLLVHENATTFVESAMLFLVTEPEPLVKYSASAFAHEESGRTVYLLEADPWAEVWFFDQRANTSYLLARLALADAAALEVRWSPDGSAFFLHAGSADDQIWNVYQIKTREGASLRETLDAIERAWWDARDANWLYLQSENETLALNIATNETVELPATIQAATHERDGFLFVEPVENQTVTSYWKNDDRVIEHVIPFGDYAFEPSPSGWTQLSDRGRGRLLLLDAQGGEQPVVLNTRAEIWQWAPDHSNRLLYSDGFDLNIYNADKHESETMTRLSTPIRAVAWDPTAQAVYYSQEGSILAIELDNRDGRIVNTLVMADEVDALWTNTNGDTLFFTGVLQGGAGIFTRPLHD